jgi:hypothetical protein
VGCASTGAWRPVSRGWPPRAAGRAASQLPCVRHDRGIGPRGAEREARHF